MTPALRSILSHPVSSQDAKRALPAIGVPLVVFGLILNAIWGLLLAGLVIAFVL